MSRFKVSTTTLSVLTISFGFFLLYSWKTLEQHNFYYTAAFDLGIFDQTIWRYANLEPPFSSLKNMIILGDHFSPGLIFLTPLYWLWSNPKILFLTQAFFASVSVLPLFLIAKDMWRVRSALGIFIYPLFTLSYFLFVGLQNALGFDFHEVTLAILPLSVLLWSLHFDERKIYWLMCFFLLTLKEDFALLTLFLGLYLMFFKRTRRQGLWTIVVSTLWFAAVSFLIMPRLNNDLIAGGYIDFYALGSTPQEMLIATLKHPLKAWQLLITPSIKLKTLLALFGSYLFLPVLSGLAVVGSLPLLLSRFLSSSTLRWGLDFHYSVTVAPLLLYGSIFGIARFRKLFRNYDLATTILVFAVFIATLTISWRHQAFLFRPFRLTAKDVTSRYEIDSVISHIPQDASVSAQSPLVPHLSQRNSIYLFPYHKDDADYVVLTLDRTSYPLKFDELENAIKQLRTSPRHKLILQQANTYLFQRR